MYSCFNLVRRRMACTVGISIKFSLLLRYRVWSEERLPNHSGKAFIPSKPHICRYTRAVKCWISSGRELSLAHPYKTRFSRDACKCWMELRLGKASSSSQNPPIFKVFKHSDNPPGRRVNFRQSQIVKLLRECNSPRSGIDIKLGHDEMYNSERDVHDCSPVGRTSTPHDIVKLRRDDTPCILGKALKLGQLDTSNVSSRGGKIWHDPRTRHDTTWN